MRKRIKYIYLAFGVSFLVTILISILYLEQFSALQKSNKDLEHSYQVKNKIIKVQSYLVDAENTQREYLITENKELLKYLRETQIGIYKEIDNLKELTAEVAELQEIIVRLKEIVAKRYSLIYQSTDAENSANITVFLNNLEKGKQTMNEFMSESNQMDKVESKLFIQRKDRTDWLQFINWFYLKLVLILSILFQLTSFLIITRSYKRRIVHQNILENKIKELNLSNSEMEQIAFVASHDLQEPMRKIRTFSDKLAKHHSAGLDKDGQKVVEKIGTASTRMQELLTDFINYTRIVQSNEEAQTVNLEKVIDDVRKDFKEPIDNKKAIIKVDNLPEIIGYNYQLHLLFSNLLDNALKFSKADTPPTINITVIDVVSAETHDERKYIRISFIDNGIGFEKEFAEKIFMIFQRLHTSDSSYLGKGIGLAICKRVMVNHGGYITATAEPGVGATFNLYFLKEPGLINGSVS